MPFTKISPVKKSKLIGSDEQVAIWDAIAHTQSHIIINALAGTGKTTTLIEALRRFNPPNAAFVAFNKSIANELATKVPTGVQACTLHSLGYKALIANGMGKTVDNEKVRKIIEGFYHGRKPSFPVRIALEKLVSLCKANLLDGVDKSNIELIIIDHNIELNGIQKDEVCTLLPQVLENCLNDYVTIDYDDMLWMPVMKGVAIRKFNTLMIDEFQDTNICQQVLSRMAGDRLILVGDKNQSIYGFRGANAEAMDVIAKELESTERGLVQLPLNTTRRCPKSHVELAKRIVPAFTSLPEKEEGVIRVTSPDKLNGELAIGMMVLSRTNAPIVSLAYSLIRQRKPAVIQGRDIGKGLSDLVRKLTFSPFNASDVDSLLTSLSTYREREATRITQVSLKHGSNPEPRLNALYDRCDCLQAITDGEETIDGVLNVIKSMFADVTADDRSSVILLSSVHRAKGLEADTVFILEPHKMPHPMAKRPWEKQQELNCTYVAITRSKHELVFVGTPHAILQYKDKPNDKEC